MENTKIKFSKNSLFRKPIAKDDGYIHFIAIGGIGMSALAKILIELGYKVSGSDIKNNANIKSIENTGGIVKIGHSSENTNNCSLVVVSSAIKPDNPELIEAKKQNIPVIHRAQLLEALMSGFGEEKKQFSVGVTGTHGKTTTSGMTAFLFEMAGLNPSFAIGGQLPHFDVNSKAGCGDYFISELDESDGSIELYTPDISIITNLEFDHADHYEKGFEQILETFERYVFDLNNSSKIIINIDDSGNLDLLKRINHKNIITYSSTTKQTLRKNADYKAEAVATIPNAKMKVFKKDEFLGEITLGVPGIHNISNALAATTAALECGVEFSQIASSLEKFTGMKRRFQTVGCYNGARIIDDYAHHPTEVEATLKTAKEVISSAQKGRVIAVFQPHRFTRLANLWQDFIKAFKDADIVYLCDVYPAGETAIENVNSENLCKEINYTKTFYVSGELENIAKAVRREISENDIILTMGAGNITQLGQILINIDYPEISLTGNELGDFDFNNISGEKIKKLRTVARKYFKENLKGTSIEHPEIGEIKFHYSVICETLGKGKLKFALMFPKLPEIIKTGKYIRIETPVHDRNDHIVKFYILENNVRIADTTGKYEFVIAEDDNGNKFYVIRDIKNVDNPNSAKPEEVTDINNITDFNNNFNPINKVFD